MILGGHPSTLPCGHAAFEPRENRPQAARPPYLDGRAPTLDTVPLFANKVENDNLGVENGKSETTTYPWNRLGLVMSRIRQATGIHRNSATAYLGARAASRDWATCLAGVAKLNLGLRPSAKPGTTQLRASEAGWTKSPRKDGLWLENSLHG